MLIKRISLSLFILALFATHARSQASVTENQTTYIYVDGSQGTDSNPGTSASPLKTIQAAVSAANANNQKSIGTKIIVNAGVYREQVSIGAVYKGTSVPLTIQAAATGTAVIAASDVLSNWVADSTTNLDTAQFQADGRRISHPLR